MVINNKFFFFFAYFTTILSSADVLNINFEFFRYLNYLLIIILTFFLVDFRNTSRDSFLLTLLSFFFISITSISKGYESSILLKYFLIIYLFFISSCERLKIPKEILNYSILYPYITLLLIGFLQSLFLNLDLDLDSHSYLFIVYKDVFIHSRPIGLALEPTFYSQQILILAVLSDYLGLKKFSKPIINTTLNLILIIILIECRSRTSVVGGILYILFNYYRFNKKTIFLYTLIPSFAFIFVERLNDQLTNFTNRIISLYSIIGREDAFIYMYKKIMHAPIFGYGLTSNIHESGLMVGALYANFPIALIYGIGIGSIPFLLLIVNLIISSLRKCKKLPILLICIFSLPMPFLYTSFGLMSLFFSTYKIKFLKEISKKNIYY